MSQTYVETQPSAANQDVDLPRGSTVGEYRIEGRLAAGGMGTVYSAVHPIIGKKAAIKVLRAEHSRDESLIKRFIDEARAVNHIGHDHIVDIFSFGTLDDGRSYFVMEWLDGESLKVSLSKRSLPFFEACALLDELCDALKAAHEKGIVHRDLKPDNVFLETRPGRSVTKLLDFGIAKLADRKSKQEGNSDTSPESVMGTPDYIAPEQAMGQPTTGAADVYSLGVMMFEMFVGRRPFAGSSPIEVIVKHVNEPPPHPRSLRPEIPQALEGLLLRMLGKQPQLRPSVQEVQSTLRELQQAAQLSTAMPSRPAGLPRPILRRRSTALPSLVRPLLSELSAGACWVDCEGDSPRVGTPVRLRFEIPRLDCQLDFDGVLGGVFGTGGQRVLIRYDRVSKQTLDRVVELGSDMARIATEPATRGQWLPAEETGSRTAWARFLGAEAVDAESTDVAPTMPLEPPPPATAEDLTIESMAAPSMVAPEVVPTQPWRGLGAKVLGLTVAIAVLAVVSVSLVALRQTRIDREFYVQDQNLTAARSMATALTRQVAVWRKQLLLTLANDAYEGPEGEFSDLAACREGSCRSVFGQIPPNLEREATQALGSGDWSVRSDGGRVWVAARGEADRWAIARVPTARLTELADVAPNVDLAIVDGGGQVLARSGPPAVGSLAAHPVLSDAQAVGRRSGARRYGDALGAWAQAEGDASGLAVVALSPESVTVDQIQVLSRQVALVALSVLAVASFLAVLLSSTTTRRLRQLAQQARRVAQGDFSESASVRGNDEVSELAEYFASMTRALQERDEQVLAAQRAMTADEARAVQRSLSNWLEQDLASRLQQIQSAVEEEEPKDLRERLRALAHQATNSLQSALLFATSSRTRVDLASAARETCEQVDRAPVSFSAPNAVLLPWVEADESRIRELLMLLVDGMARTSNALVEVQLSQRADKNLLLRILSAAPHDAVANLVQRSRPLAEEQGAKLRFGKASQDRMAIAMEFEVT